ncbi:MAG: hypothetical protein ACRYGF_16620 [Janthinobacterium lividum]
MKMQLGVTAVMAGILAMVPMTMQAQANNGPAPSVTGTNSGVAGVASAELMSSTVHEAWLKSGRNEDKFFDMVKELAAISAQKRGVTLPDTEAAGRKMGMLIKTSARRDPDQSLYAVVDAAVKQTATAAK